MIRLFALNLVFRFLDRILFMETNRPNALT